MPNTPKRSIVNLERAQVGRRTRHSIPAHPRLLRLVLSALLPSALMPAVHIDTHHTHTTPPPLLAPSSLTLAVVVRMRSCSTKDVTMFRSMAHRWDDVRPSLRYGMALLCVCVVGLCFVRRGKSGDDAAA